MATAQPSCDICLNLHVTKSACVWCSECEEAICEDCVQRHRIQKATKNHKTILIEDYQQLPISILNIKLECGDHNQKLDFYCSNHNEPCCTRCVSENHKDCRDLKPLPEVVEGVKSSAAFSDLEDRVKDLSQVIGQTIQEKLNIKSELEVQRNSIISEVEGARKAINIHLDKIQDKLLNNLTTNEAQQRDNIDRLVGKLSKMQNSVNEIVYAVEKTKQHASNFQTFLGVNKWIIEIENHESEWKSAQSDQSMATVHLQMRMNPLLKKLEKDVFEFGKIEVNFSLQTKLALRKDKQGQELLISSPKSISEIELSKLSLFHIPKGISECMIKGCDVFEDGRIVFADFSFNNKRLVVLNADYSLNKEIPFDERPIDVTIVESNTVAVTLFEMKDIHIVDVRSSKIIRTIALNKKCYGIYFTGGKLNVCLEQNVMKTIDLSGNTLKTISQMGLATYCSVTNDLVYYSVYGCDAVYCCDLNGNVQWKFSCSKSDFPNGIAHDASGNVFVTCRDANKVIVIASNGKESRILLSSGDGLQKPVAIHYNRKSDVLLVCNRLGQCFLYKITN